MGLEEGRLRKEGVRGKEREVTETGIEGGAEAEIGGVEAAARAVTDTGGGEADQDPEAIGDIVGAGVMSEGNLFIVYNSQLQITLLRRSKSRSGSRKMRKERERESRDSE